MRLGPGSLLFAALVAASSCKRAPAVYEHAIHVESVDLSTHPVGHAVVRLTRADGQPAPLPTTDSVSIHVDGELADGRPDWQLVRGGGVRTVIVLDPGLGAAPLGAQRELASAVIGHLGAGDRVALQTVGGPAPEGTGWLDPPAAAARLAALVLEPSNRPSGTVGAAARARVPPGVLGPAFALLEQVSEPGVRRTLILPVRGNPTGRLWSRVVAQAVASASSVLVLGFPRGGGRPPRGRAAPPTLVFPVDLDHPLDALSEALQRTVAGGARVRFELDSPAPMAAAGLSLRAQLPRGGWEDFSTPALDQPTGTLVVDEVVISGELCTATLRAVDPVGRPLDAARGGVSVLGPDGPIEGVGAEVEPKPIALVVVADLLRPRVAPEALRAAVEAARAALGPGDSILVTQRGRVPDTPAFAAATAALDPGWPPDEGGGVITRDLVTDLDALSRAVGEGPGDARLAYLVVSSPVSIRALETFGNPTPRFRRLLAGWRGAGKIPAWVVDGPEGAGDRAAAELRRTGGLYRTAGPAGGLQEAITATVRALRAASRVRFACPPGGAAAGKRLRFRTQHLGRAITSAPPAAVK